jgi:hypothetical protein
VDSQCICAILSFVDWPGRVDTKSVLGHSNRTHAKTSQIGIVYLVVGSFGLAMYMFIAVFVYLGEKDLERYTAEVRTSRRDLESGPSPDSSISSSSVADMYSGGHAHSKNLVGGRLELHLDGADKFKRETMQSLFN